MAKYYLSLMFLILGFSSFGGVIKGSVVEDKNSAPMVSVVISYKAVDSLNGSNGGGISDIDGKFELTGVKKGEYIVTFSYLNFTKETRTVKVENSDVILDIRMKELVQEMAGVEIKAKKTTNTEAAVINEIKTSNAVVSGTSSSQISKSMDRNAADVVKRIPGVSIQDDRFVVVRGLPDRYNSVWLNDAGAPSSEADKKSFSFDIIPSGLIDRVLVFKTPSPELPGDFAGGMVKVYTTSLQDKNSLSVSLQTSSRENTTGKTFLYNQPSKTDWLGYDDGSRNIPAGTPAILDKATAGQDNVAISRAFKNDWIVKSKTAAPDKRFSMAYTGGYKAKNFRIGNTFGITYSNTSTAFATNRQDWDSTIDINYNYHDQIYTSSVNVGLLENVGFSMGNTKIEFKNLYSQTGKATLLVRDAIWDSTQGGMRGYAMGYDSKATYSTQLSGTHKNEDETRKYNWTIGYNDLFKNQPDLRRIKYSQYAVNNDTFFRANVSAAVDPNFGGGRYYAALYEKVYSFNHQFSQKISIGKDFSFWVNAGNYIEFKRRALNIRKFSYTLKSGIGTSYEHRDSLLKSDINNIFDDKNVGGPKDFIVSEDYDVSDRYSAKNDLIASFVSVNVPVTKKINLVAGVRNEINTQSILSYRSSDTLTPTLKTNYYLPSFNISYNFSDKSLIRGAYGKTLNRPEFREFAPVGYYDFENVMFVKGSLNESSVNPSGDTLKTAQIQNFDLRYELYPSAGEMIHIGGFYKSLNSPIMRVLDPSAVGDNRTITYINSNTAYCAGLELDIRKNLGFLDSKLGTKFLRDLSFVGNFTLATSKSKLDTTRKHYQIPEATMQGQSPYLVNMGMYYQNDMTGIKSSLLYNVYGPRLYATGTIMRGGESIGELPFQSLDLTVSKLIHKHYLINFGVQNLLNSAVSFVKDSNRDGKFDSKNDRQYSIYRPGRYYTLGVKLNF
jgi:TonB-dependent receptor